MASEQLSICRSRESYAEQRIGLFWLRQPLFCVHTSIRSQRGCCSSWLHCGQLDFCPAGRKAAKTYNSLDETRQAFACTAIKVHSGNLGNGKHMRGKSAACDFEPVTATLPVSQVLLPGTMDSIPGCLRAQAAETLCTVLSRGTP